MALIEEAIFARLFNADDLRDWINDRIYPGRIPDHDGPTPWIYFAVMSSVPIEDLEGAATEAVHTVELDCLAETYDDNKRLHRMVQELLDGWSDRPTVKQCTWTGTTLQILEYGYNATVTVTIRGPALS